MSRLAIVIPAFKSVYLDKTLLSIANQTCQDFSLYIGNDASPYDLKSIVDLYNDRLDIIYKEFNENLGGKDLVAHWERCIDMVMDEEWIWLFSDDDIMDRTCVERFYSEMNQNQNFDLFHFNVTQIDESDKIIKDLTSYPKVLTNEEYLNRRLKGDFYSFVVEYVFRKSHFLREGRFENFDLAWGSDDATWIKLSNRNGILNIDKARVYWRESRFNISPNNSDKEILRRKFISQIAFAKWVNDYFTGGEIHIDRNNLKDKLSFLFIKTIKDRIEFISFGMLKRVLSQFYRELFQKNPPLKKIMFLYCFKIYRTSKEAIKKLVFWDILNVKTRKAFLSVDM